MPHYELNAQSGFTPGAVTNPHCDNPRKGNTSSSLSAGAVWGDRHGPLLHCTGILNFISMEKEFYRTEIYFFTIKKIRENLRNL
jgi:hypothetical protein